MKNNIFIPADVPTDMHETFKENMRSITRGTKNLFLFACDQKIEHLNDDFYGPDIHADAEHPAHLFKIAEQSSIGAMATHVGLIERYGPQHREINYIAKINAKTNLIPLEQCDPLSTLLWDVHNVVQLARESNLKIRGIGLTVYLGSEFEGEMLQDAAQQIFDAHLHGFVTILWIYPRGKAIQDEQDPKLLAGAAGIANALGADFVKIKAPHDVQQLKHIVAAAGNTRVICAGGEQISQEKLLAEIIAQMQQGAAGCAIGRNLFQRSEKDAIDLAKKISEIVYAQD